MEYEYELKRLENIERLRGMISKIKTGMFTTYSTTQGFHSRPMGTAQLDVDGNLWFYTNEFSTKVTEVSIDNKVSVTYADVPNNTYVSVTGDVYLSDDREKIIKLWNPELKFFFPKGIDDPQLILIKVDTDHAEYWDTSKSQIEILFKRLKAVIKGEKFDKDEHKELDL
ncbi:pyridoxamine 5'-phosphate oxidase family protein [Mucilaginibacter agri]|uniref:Pyridoxamine 5'-phosphate oxidase family protein n=1 Tax=Mucilaginibacter agri TaxID=2695265 RepID=A0A965ZLG6_9SPHI|nr:pyridoxamine 5'-phosphate oxidase family protein [Mucilaginibacter agri]NCD71822.1 pyridoxamine 5'-phosphate oxidase family protein [Mucilaginibacter agri]